MRIRSLFLAVALLSIGSEVAAQTCKSFSSCSQAVQSYRSGNSKLDHDKDGHLRISVREDRREHALRLLSPLLLWIVTAAPLHAIAVISVVDRDTIRVREAG